MKNSFFALSAFLLFFSSLLISCSKDDSSTSTTLQVRLTDSPAALDSVLIDIREVRVKMNDDSTSNEGWVAMETNAGIYDLLLFQNNTDTLIATATLPTGTLKQLRLVLGNENRVVVSGVSYPLTIPSGSESGLKLNFSKNLNAMLETITIDFDAALSIHEENGNYKLRPVLQIR